MPAQILVSRSLEIVDYHQEGTMARTPIHAGEHLALELNELRISAAELVRQIDVPVNRIRQSLTESVV